jgi:hypothetical protein
VEKAAGSPEGEGGLRVRGNGVSTGFLATEPRYALFGNGVPAKVPTRVAK